MRGAKRRAVARYDVREIELAACRIRAVRMRWHCSLKAREIGALEQVQR